MDIETNFDIIVIGAGPAGLQVGQHLQKMGMRYVILEAGSAAGTSFEHYPRHRKLISINKVHTGYEDPEVNLRWDWNSLLAEDELDPLLFKEYSKRYFPDAGDMVRYLAQYADKHALNVRYDARVTEVRKPGPFEVKLADGEILSARVVVVSTGVSQAWLPQVPGIEHAVPYTVVSTDQDAFVNQRVLIIGKGNSAFETADHLIDVASMIHLCSPNSLKMAWSTHFVGHLRAVNNNFLDTYQLKSQNAVMDAIIASIEPEEGRFKVTFEYAHAEGEVEVIYYDRVIACTGFRFDAGIFAEECRPDLCPMGKFPAQSPSWESTNVPDLYFAGTIMQYRDYKKFMSGFIHGFRYNVRTLCRLLAEKYMDMPYPTMRIEGGTQTLIETIAQRINRSSGLWQQPGFLCDVFVEGSDGESFEHRQELPIDLIHERWSSSGLNYMTVSLEFGQRKFDNPFNVPRIARDNVGSARESNFLHPVVRYFRMGELMADHHVIEDLAGEWREPEHLLPLREFLGSLEVKEECQ